MQAEVIGAFQLAAVKGKDNVFFKSKGGEKCLVGRVKSKGRDVTEDA